MELNVSQREIKTLLTQRTQVLAHQMVVQNSLEHNIAKFHSISQQKEEKCTQTLFSDDNSPKSDLLSFTGITGYQIKG
jgi:hypothetical protein